MLKSLFIFIAIIILSCSGSAMASENGTIPLQKNTLLVIGDSLTSGLYATHEQATFVSMLGTLTGKRIARRHSSNLPVAATTWAEVKAWRPEIVVLEVGLNDVSKGALTDQEWQDVYMALVADIKANGAKVVACTMFWGGITDQHPNYAKYLRYNDMIRHVADAQDVGLADLWQVTQGCTACVSRAETLSYFAPHYHGDNFHPSDDGHELIAETIVDVLSKKYYFPGIFSQ